MTFTYNRECGIYLPKHGK